MTERVINISTYTILKVIGIILGLVLLWLVRDVIILVFLALFLSALIQPAANWSVRHKIPRGLMVVFVYLVSFGLLAFIMALMIPTLIEQAVKLTSIFGEKWVIIQDFAKAATNFATSHSLSSLKPDLNSIWMQVGGTVTGLFNTLSNVVGGLVSLIIVLVMTYYLVAQDRKALTIIQDFVPVKHQKFAMNLVEAVQAKMGGWFRGQILLCFIIGLLYYIGLLIIGIESPLVLALFGGLTEFIPYLGPILGGIPIVFVAFVASPWKGLLALILLVIIQQAEGHFIVPKVMQKAVGLNPLISIIALLVGAQLYGILGALLAIPVATAVSVVYKEVRNYWPTSTQ
ncbi:MAG: AI-2E family transporter [Patescibacteria group bacterium]|nr:AI-2E family transporter [Patescibacteria group bacterium]